MGKENKFNGSSEGSSGEPRDLDGLDEQVRKIHQLNYVSFLKRCEITEKQFMEEYGIVSDFYINQDYTQYIMFYKDLFDKTATDPRPLLERTPSYPVLFSLVHLLPETGDAFDSTKDNKILEDISSYSVAALMAVTASDPDLPIEGKRDAVVIKVFDKLPNRKDKATSEVLIRKEYVIQALIIYMMGERKIGYQDNFTEKDYVVAGNAVIELVQRYRDELNKLPFSEAQFWRRYKYIFSPGFEEDLQKYVTAVQQSQAKLKAKEAEVATLVQGTILKDKHFTRFAELLGIKGQLPERYKTILEHSLVNMKQNPLVHERDVESAETDPDSFLIGLLFHTVFTEELNPHQFVTRQFPGNKGIIRFTFGGVRVGNIVFGGKHLDIISETETDWQAKTIKSKYRKVV